MPAHGFEMPAVRRTSAVAPAAVDDVAPIVLVVVGSSDVGGAAVAVVEDAALVTVGVRPSVRLGRAGGASSAAATSSTNSWPWNRACGPAALTNAVPMARPEPMTTTPPSAATLLVADASRRLTAGAGAGAGRTMTGSSRTHGPTSAAGPGSVVSVGPGSAGAGAGGAIRLGVCGRGAGVGGARVSARATSRSVTPSARANPWPSGSPAGMCPTSQARSSAP